MAKNDYQARLKAREMTILRAGIEIGRQQMCDYISLAAHDQKVMGRALSAESINRMLNGCASKMEEYTKAFERCDEADYVQERMDDALRDIYGENLVKFPERYPHMKMFNYKNGKWE